jgi:hypothetical protein
MILFGGSNAVEEVNTVRVFEFLQGRNDSNSNALTYSLRIQPCVGDIPPPTHGHAACILGRRMFVFGGSTSGNEIEIGMSSNNCNNDMYTLEFEEWKWKKLSSLSGTPNAGYRPEIDVCFCSLVPLDDYLILLAGDFRSNASSGRGGRYGMNCKDDDFDGNAASPNMHVFSIRSGQWKPLNCAGKVSTIPEGWGLQAHNIGKGKVLLLGGQQENRIDNSLYL